MSRGGGIKLSLTPRNASSEQTSSGKIRVNFTDPLEESTFDKENSSPTRPAKGNETSGLKGILKDRPIEKPVEKVSEQKASSGKGSSAQVDTRPSLKSATSKKRGPSDFSQFAQVDTRPSSSLKSATSEKRPPSDFSQFAQSINRPTTSEKRPPADFHHLSTGSNAIPIRRNKNANRPKGQSSENEMSDEEKAEFNKLVANALNVSSRTLKEDRPRGYVPRNRTIDAIYEEDAQSKDLYAHAFEEDEKIEVTGLDSPPACIEAWTDIPLHKTVLDNINSCNYVRPRRIQSYTIPLILEGRDVKAQAETGSGKSGSFLIPIISKIAEENDKTPRLKKECLCPRAIVIAPTRELVLQLAEQAMKIARDTKVQVKFCYGEYDFCFNSFEIFKGTDLLVSTPGRLVHFMTSSIVGIDRVKYLILDEADRLLDDAFIESFKQMILLPGFPLKEQIQMMLFSATYPTNPANWIESLLKSNRVVIKNVRANEPNLRIRQSFEECSTNNKTVRLLDYCQDLITEYQKSRGSDVFPQILAFVRKCDTADAYTFYLNHNGIKTLSLNSKRGQKLREQSLSLFRNKKVTMLIATDVCSRGLDIKNLDFVINVDLPDEFSTYVQRIGRTGRLRHGFAHSFVDMINDNEIIPKLVNSLEAENQVVPEFMMKVQMPVVKLERVEREYAGFDEFFE